MCRWLVYFGNEKILLADLITRPKHSIVQQSFCDPYLPFIDELTKQKLTHKINGDGFGLAWYGGSSEIPCVFTSIKPCWSDRNLQRLAEHVSSNCVFSHIRAASPGSLIVENNCHPFQFGRILFMHNGAIAHFPKIKKKLISQLSENSFSYIQGTTDSEHVGALFVQFLPNQDPFVMHSVGELKEAMLKTIDHIIKLTQEVIGSSDDSGASSLNFAVTDGGVVITTRFRNSETEDPPSLYYTKTCRYFSPCGSCDDSQALTAVVISSEPLNDNLDEWALVPKNHLVVVEKNRVSLEAIEVPISLRTKPSVGCCWARALSLGSDSTKQATRKVKKECLAVIHMEINTAQLCSFGMIVAVIVCLLAVIVSCTIRPCEKVIL